MTAVVAAGFGYLAGGSAGPELFERHARFWTSRDGVAWDPVADEAATFADAEVTAIAPFEDGFVAVGALGPAQHRTGAVAWTSPDGLTWTRIDNGAFEDAVAVIHHRRAVRRRARRLVRTSIARSRLPGPHRTGNAGSESRSATMAIAETSGSPMSRRSMTRWLPSARRRQRSGRRRPHGYQPTGSIGNKRILSPSWSRSSCWRSPREVRVPSAWVCSAGPTRPSRPSC